jgi:ABC-type Fe3+/spermidine/putrescine transport system ATPase subunit
VALARAIVHEPRLVLFDEPLSNLDAKLREQMRTELKLLQSRLGFTAIYVTHDQAEALALSDNVVVMNHGLIEGMAPPRELFAHPTTPFVANFLGFDNMFEGKVAWVGAAGNGGAKPASGDGAALPIGVTVGKDVTLRCFWREGVAPSSGEPVILAFRSERVTLGLLAGQDDPGTNRYDGSVEACVYVGTYQDYLIQAGSIRVRAVGPGDSTFGQGERVTVSIRPDDCRVFSRKKYPGWRGSGE